MKHQPEHSRQQSLGSLQPMLYVICLYGTISCRDESDVPMTIDHISTALCHQIQSRLQPGLERIHTIHALTVLLQRVPDMWCKSLFSTGAVTEELMMTVAGSMRVHNTQLIGISNWGCPDMSILYVSSDVL